MTAMERKALRLKLAGKRPSDTMAVAKPALPNLHLRLLGDLQRIVDLDAEIPNCAFEFRVPEQKLNGSQISGSLLRRSVEPTADSVEKLDVWRTRDCV